MGSEMCIRDSSDTISLNSTTFTLLVKFNKSKGKNGGEKLCLIISFVSSFDLWAQATKIGSFEEYKVGLNGRP